MESSSFIQFGLIIASILALAAVTIKKLLEKHWKHADIRDVDARSKIIIITGAGSGIGFETAVEIANRGATVIVTGRTMKAAQKTVLDIRHRTFLGKLIPMKLELSSLNSVKNFCEEVKNSVDKIDILINNAGVLIPVNKPQKTLDGMEIHIGVNHISHFLLTNLLLPLLRKPASSRIVILTSVAHRGAKLNFEDLMFEKSEIVDGGMSGNPLYKCSKLANILFARELAKRLEKTNIHVYACCPGIVNTNISRNFDMPWYYSLLLPLVGILFKSPNQGCQTVLHCALSEKCNQDSGLLYRNCAVWNTWDYAIPDDIFVPRSSGILYSQNECEKLWAESEKLCQMKFDLI